MHDPQLYLELKKENSYRDWDHENVPKFRLRWWLYNCKYTKSIEMYTLNE